MNFQRLCIIGPFMVWWVLGVSVASGIEKDDFVAGLVDGIIARAEAIYSGQFRYVYKPEKNQTFSIEMSFMDHNAAYHIYEVNGQRSSRPFSTIDDGDSYLKFEPYTSENGEPFYVAELRPPRSSKEIVREGALLPNVGSFWRRWGQSIEKVKYLSENKPELVGGVKTVNGVDVYELHWHVEDGNLRQALGSVISRKPGGATIRVYVAANLGYVLPRIEHLQPMNGVVTRRYDYFDFHEVSAGIFFPRSAQYEKFVPDRPKARDRFEEIEVVSLNEHIPDRDFILDLPIGTRVFDYREGEENRIVFDLADGLSRSTEDIDEQVAFAVKEAAVRRGETPVSPRGRRRTWALIAAASFGFLVVFAFGWRTWVSSR